MPSLRLFAVFLFLICLPASASPSVGTVTVNVTPRPTSTFRPSQAFGAGVDGLERGDVARVYTPANLRAMRNVGYGALTYRLRTELGVDAWHWNPRGTWSDGGRPQGYWTSEASAGPPILTCHGYRLPRRGSTIDQAENDGYSRLDDGDAQTFWKSNPYLDRHFTGEDNARHPQWVVVDLGRPRLVNAVRILWGVPFATEYRWDFWPAPEPKNDQGISNTFGAGNWRPFPSGIVTHGTGGNILLRLSQRPVTTRWVRLWLTESSEAGPPAARDVRDRLGYAIRELGVGLTDERGHFHDWVRHAKSHGGQTILYASSTDSWHRAADRDLDVEQPGFDRVYRSGLTHAQPVLVPVGLLYDTPNNAAAEIRWLERRGYPVRGVELGEEPDGQYLSPEDYGALYVQWAEALRRVDPRLMLGGPSFQTSIYGWVAWPDARGDRSWMRRFVRYLKARGRLAEFQFFSFEWYPFDNVCGPTAPQLTAEPALLENALARLHREGLPPDIPAYITEYGYSAFAGQPEVDLAGALLDTEVAAQFLTLGGTTACLYGLEPNSLIRESDTCDSWGNLALFLSDGDRHIKAPLATFYAERLLTREWALPTGNGVHQVYCAGSDVRNRIGQALVTAYTVHRPDGQWAVLLLNKDPRRSHAVRIRFWGGGADHSFTGPVTTLQYGPAQYVWRAHGENGFPSPDLPPVRVVIESRATSVFRLPPYSLSVVRGLVMLR